MKVLIFIGGTVIIALIAYGTYALINNVELKSEKKKEIENEHETDDS